MSAKTSVRSALRQIAENSIMCGQTAEQTERLVSSARDYLDRWPDSARFLVMLTSPAKGGRNV